MNWTFAIAEVLTLLGVFAGGVWWLSAFNQRFSNHEANTRERFLEHEKQLQRLRDWRHNRVSPILQSVLIDHESRHGEKLLSYSDLDDSSVTNDPEKEPTR